MYPSGILPAAARSAAVLGQRETALPCVERAIAQTLGRHEPIFVCSVPRLMELAADDHFERDLTEDVHERCVTFLPGDRRWDRALPMTSRRNDVTLIVADGPEVFSVTHATISRAVMPRCCL